jgi:hypothetical protein
VNISPRFLAVTGAAIAGPSFILNAVAHGGELPNVDDVDRLDGLFSLMFMVGAAFVMASLFAVRPSPLGRRGRFLLYPEALMVGLGGMWAVFILADPGFVHSEAPLVMAGDASWPLHQVFMAVVGATAAVSKRWPSPARFTLFGPAAGIVVLGLGAATGVDLLAAFGIGAGWVITAAGVVSVTKESNPQGVLAANPAAAA